MYLRMSRAPQVSRVPLVGTDEDYVGAGIHGWSSVIGNTFFTFPLDMEASMACSSAVVRAASEKSDRIAEFNDGLRMAFRNTSISLKCGGSGGSCGRRLGWISPLRPMAGPCENCKVFEVSRGDVSRAYYGYVDQSLPVHSFPVLVCFQMFN